MTISLPSNAIVTVTRDSPLVVLSHAAEVVWIIDRDHSSWCAGIQQAVKRSRPTCSIPFNLDEHITVLCTTSSASYPHGLQPAGSARRVVYLPTATTETIPVLYFAAVRIGAPPTLEHLHRSKLCCSPTRVR